MRFLLAISVVLSHSAPKLNLLIGGQYAVQLFYITSGFLISQILNNSQTYTKINGQILIRKFYISRFLRIWPAYITIALLTLFANIIANASYLFDTYRNIPLSAQIILILVNMTLFGQDMVMFLGITDNELVFTNNYTNSEVSLWNGLLVPQAWSLGLEISFYLLAPLFIKSIKKLLLILLFSLIVKFLIYDFKFYFDPWSYRFFPAELSLFIIGILINKVSLILKIEKRIPSIFINCVLIINVTIIILYPFIAFTESYKYLLLLSTYSISLPALLGFSTNNKFDKKFGELSYPIYITHMLVIISLQSITNKLNIIDQVYILPLFSILVTIACSIILIKYVIDPIEYIRNKFKIVSI